MSNQQLCDYINCNDSFAMRYILLVDAIEELEEKALAGCIEAKQELAKIQKQIDFYKLCRKDKLFGLIAKC